MHKLSTTSQHHTLTGGTGAYGAHWEKKDRGLNQRQAREWRACPNPSAWAWPPNLQSLALGTLSGKKLRCEAEQASWWPGLLLSWPKPLVCSQWVGAFGGPLSLKAPHSWVVSWAFMPRSRTSGHLGLHQTQTASLINMLEEDWAPPWLASAGTPPNTAEHPSTAAGQGLQAQTWQEKGRPRVALWSHHVRDLPYTSLLTRKPEA